MEKEIKVLLVGKEPFSGKKHYIGFKDKEYPFPTVAFIPQLKKNVQKKYDFYDIVSYRRVMSLFAGKALTKKDFVGYNNVDSIVEMLKEKGIYLTNINEVKEKHKKYIKNHLTSNSIVILLGKDAQKGWKRKFSNNTWRTVEFMHPSARNVYSDWYEFDIEMQKNSFKKHAIINEIQEEINFTL